MDGILTKWRANGDKITHFVDGNKNVAKGKTHTLLRRHNL